MKTLNEHTILFYLFVFSILTTLRLTIKFISALQQNPPQRFVLSGRELLFYGGFFSYLITYILN